MTACHTFALGALQAGLPSGHNLEAGAEASEATDNWDFVCSFGNSNA